MSSLRLGSRASCPTFAPGGVLVACALGACAAPSLPPPELPLFPTASAPCTVVVEQLEHLDQPSALGFSAIELLARVAGESVSPLVWLPPEPSPGYTLAYGPESGRSHLRLRVAPAEGQVRYRHELLSQDAPEGTECADGVLEVPVSVSIQSDTQALDETFAARLEASAVYRARLSHRFAPGSLSGGFTFTELSSLDPEHAFSAGAFSLEVVLWEGGSQGSFSTEVQSRYTPKASAAARAGSAPPADSASLALWPSAEACGVPASSHLPSGAKVLGFSVSDVLEALATEGTRELTWSSGDATALELDFGSPASELCQEVVADSLTFDTTVRVHTSNGRVSAEVPVQINASNEGGAIGEVRVQTPEDAPSSPALATLTSFRSVGSTSVEGRAGRGSSPTLEPRARQDVRVDLDASFRGGLSAGTLTLSDVDSAVPSGPASAASRELASGRWGR